MEGAPKPRGADEAGISSGGEAERKGAEAEAELTTAAIAAATAAAAGEDRFSGLPLPVFQAMGLKPEDLVLVSKAFANKGAGTQRYSARTVRSAEDMARLSDPKNFARINSATTHLKIERFKDRSNDEVLDFLEKFTNLQSLEVDFHFLSQLTSDQRQRLSEIIGGMGQLTGLHLNLSLNNIGVAGVAPLAGALKILTNLKTLHLNLAQNYLGPENMMHVTEALETLTNLEALHLNLAGNNLGPVGMTHLARALKTLTNLKTLHLNMSENDIGLEGVVHLASALKTLTNLQGLHLNLRWNRLGPDSAAHVAEALKNLTNLRTLNLDLNLNYIGFDFEKHIETKAGIQEYLKNPFTDAIKIRMKNSDSMPSTTALAFGFIEVASKALDNREELGHYLEQLKDTRVQLKEEIDEVRTWKGLALFYKGDELKRWAAYGGANPARAPGAQDLEMIRSAIARFQVIYNSLPDE